MGYNKKVSIDDDLELLMSSISEDIDANIARWKRLGKTFDLLYVVKLVSAKYAAKARSELMANIYTNGEDHEFMSEEYDRSARLVTSINNMIRVETT